MDEMVEISGLQVADELARFMAEEALPGTGITPDHFWAQYAAILADLGPKNAALLAVRDALQAKIDAWHRAFPARPVNAEAYTRFLREIGYLLPEGDDFAVDTAFVDHEIARKIGRAHV